MSTVSSVLHYGASLSPTEADEGWVIDAISRPPGLLYNFRDFPVEVPIADLRDRAEQPTLDVAGFERLNAPSAVDQDALLGRDGSALERYRRELGTLLRSRTGADSVIFFDATVRRDDADRDSHVGVAAPHERVHVDQNPRSARARAVGHGGADRKYRRFQIVNAWRPLLHPVRNHALALCDFRSLDPTTDLVPTQLRFPAWLKDRENYSVKYRPGHRWFYWKSLTPDELILFKCHDSASRRLPGSCDEPGDPTHADVAGLCPHSSFTDLAAPTVGRLRTSLEVRALLFYD